MNKEKILLQSYVEFRLSSST